MGLYQKKKQKQTNLDLSSKGKNLHADMNGKFSDLMGLSGKNAYFIESYFLF